jgi:uncharacterized protein YndB with AHSA1/START domain
MAFTATEIIDRPADQVWQVLTDWSRAPEWMPGVAAARVDGDTLRFTARGRERTSEITDLRPGTSVTLTSVQGGVRAAYTYEVAAAGPATTVTLVATLATSGPWRLAAPMLRVLVRRADGGQLTALKRVIESSS